MDDMISRQAAIDAVRSYYDECDDSVKSIEERIDALPSAQPEILACGEGELNVQPKIVRCKDCKHYWIHKCMDSMPIERCDLGQTFYDAEVDFCSLAEKREVTT